MLSVYVERAGSTVGVFVVGLAVVDGTWYCFIGCGVPYLKKNLKKKIERSMREK